MSKLFVAAKRERGKAGSARGFHLEGNPKPVKVEVWVARGGYTRQRERAPMVRGGVKAAR